MQAQTEFDKVVNGEIPAGVRYVSFGPSGGLLVATAGLPSDGPPSEAEPLIKSPVVILVRDAGRSGRGAQKVGPRKVGVNNM